jgi:aminopeptidase N
VIGPKAYMKWLEQCRATTTIKERYGPQSAFDYLVSEKLLEFASAAEREAELARQLPRFVSEVRRIFEADEIRANLDRIEREQEAEELLALDEEAYGGDDLFREDPVISAARARSFMLIKQLLLTPQLGTS